MFLLSYVKIFFVHYTCEMQDLNEIKVWGFPSEDGLASATFTPNKTVENGNTLRK